MKYVVINLDRSTERMDFIATQFAECQRKFTRFSAIGNASPETDALLNKAKFHRIFGRRMSNGELGCFKSHVQCLRDFIAGSDEAVLIFEDDVCIDERSFKAIDELMVHLPTLFKGWQCVNLSSTYSKRFAPVTDINGLQLRRAWQFPILASALLWSRAGAKQFLDDLDKQGIYAPFDDQVRYVLTRSGQGFCFDRPPVGLAHFASDIASVDVSSDKGSRALTKKIRRNSVRDVIKRTPFYGWSLLHTLMYRSGMLR